jgi:hypothetical protein
LLRILERIPIKEHAPKASRSLSRQMSSLKRRIDLIEQRCS